MGTKMIETTYNELVELRNNSKLISGCMYKITDYVTTSTDPETKVANNQFDIVVRALDESHLFEEARICKHEDVDYFDNVKLGSWRVWYCLDNDINMYKWADPINGKGVIYRMIDEFNNDCSYDFANILFRKTAEWCKEHKNWCESVLGFVPKNDIYFYTFTWLSRDNRIEDLTIIGHKMTNASGGITGVHDNSIAPCDDPMGANIYRLGHNVFVSTEYWQDRDSFAGLYGNNLRSNCRDNIFGNECQYNILYNNCIENVFGNYCQSNKLMIGCMCNNFKSSSYSNTLGCGCSCISLNDSSYNSFGPECCNIKAAVSMHCNTFGSYCQHIVCGNPNLGYGRNIKFNIFENNIRNVNFRAAKAFSTGSVQNITVCQGVQGSHNNPLEINIPMVNQDFQLKVAFNSTGDLKIYCEADLI